MRGGCLGPKEGGGGRWDTPRTIPSRRKTGRGVPVQQLARAGAAAEEPRHRQHARRATANVGAEQTARGERWSPGAGARGSVADARIRYQLDLSAKASVNCKPAYEHQAPAEKAESQSL